jgi:hypothetical protein
MRTLRKMIDYEDALTVQPTLHDGIPLSDSYMEE